MKMSFTFSGGIYGVPHTFTFLGEAGEKLHVVKGMDAIHLHTEIMRTAPERKSARTYELYLMVTGKKPPQQKRRKGQ